MQSELWHSVTVCMLRQLSSVICLGTARFAMVCDMKIVRRVIGVVAGCALRANVSSANQVRSFIYVSVHHL